MPKCAFRVDQKVVCVKDDWNLFAEKYITPKIGDICTINYIGPWPPNYDDRWIFISFKEYQGGFKPDRFRPLTDISIFTAMLNCLPAKEKLLMGDS